VTETNRQNLAVFQRLIEDGFNAGDTSSLLPLFTEDFVEHQDDGQGAPSGLEAVTAKIHSLHAAFPDFSLTIEDVVADGDRVWARLRGRGTNTGPFIGPPTGKQMSIDVIDICRFRDGQIAEHWGVADRLASLQQIGRMPQSSRAS
jgi:predicted ester cyclase